MENTEHIGLKIAGLRRIKGCTQAELGAYLNISAQAVSKWERGESCPDFDTLCKIAAFFEVTITYFEKGTAETTISVRGNNEEVEVKEEKEAEKKMLGVCKTCGKVVYEGNEGKTAPVLICKVCVEREHQAAATRVAAQKAQAEKEREAERLKRAQKAIAIKKSRNRGFIWGSVVATIVLLLGIIGVVKDVQGEMVGKILGVALFSGLIFVFVSQLFWEGVVLDCATFGGKVIGTPGIIFTFDLDGFIFLIAMKILFALLRFAVYITTLLFFVVVAMLISPFTFIPALLRVNSGDLVY